MLLEKTLGLIKKEVNDVATKRSILNGLLYEKVSLRDILFNKYFLSLINVISPELNTKVVNFITTNTSLLENYLDIEIS